MLFLRILITSSVRIHRCLAWGPMGRKFTWESRMTWCGRLATHLDLVIVFQAINTDISFYTPVESRITEYQLVGTARYFQLRYSAEMKFIFLFPSQVYSYPWNNAHIIANTFYLDESFDYNGYMAAFPKFYVGRKAIFSGPLDKGWKIQNQKLTAVHLRIPTKFTIIFLIIMIIIIIDHSPFFRRGRKFVIKKYRSFKWVLSKVKWVRMSGLKIQNNYF